MAATAPAHKCLVVFMAPRLVLNLIIRLLSGADELSGKVEAIAASFGLLDKLTDKKSGRPRRVDDEECSELMEDVEQVVVVVVLKVMNSTNEDGTASWRNIPPGKLILSGGGDCECWIERESWKDILLRDIAANYHDSTQLNLLVLIWGLLCYGALILLCRHRRC